MSDRIRIERLSRGNKRFYALFGPVFGSRAIAKEVGISAYDDENKVWLAAFVGDVMVGVAVCSRSRCL